MMYSLVSRDVPGNEFKIVDSYGEKYSNHYSSDGSGFGYMTFTLYRKYGVNYPDIGFGYRITLYKGLRFVLYDGVITKIEESNTGEINVSCVGFTTLFSFDILNIVLSDKRTNKWISGCKNRGSFRPDKFEHTLQWSIIYNEGTESEYETSFDGVQILPRNGVDYILDDYYYVRYRFEFGETARRLRATYRLNSPNNFPVRVDIVDADDNVIWTADTTTEGTFDLDLDATYLGNFVEVRMIVTASGLCTTDAVYFRMWDITVASVSNDIDANDVLTTLMNHMATNYGFSNSNTFIDTIGYELPQAAYDNDETLDAIAKNAVSFGDSSLNPLAWGTLLDSTKRVFLEVQDFTTIQYVIQESQDFSVVADVVESFQKIYGKYNDAYGRVARTDVVLASPEITQLGLYKKSVMEFDTNQESQVTQAITLALNENKQPKISTSFSVVGSINTILGGSIPVDEIQSGGMVRVQTMSARETVILDDRRKGFHTFMLTVVEIDLESQTASLSPAQAKTSFEKYMEVLARLAK